jgi:ketosteroid isomerase-like protein
VTADSPQTCTADFTGALIRRDISSAIALITDDVVFFYSNGTAIVGKDAFAAQMTASWKVVEQYRYAAGRETWLAQSDDAAAVIYSFAWSGVARGAEVSGGGRATRLLRKDPGAGWRVAHEHLSEGEWP